VRSRGLSGSFEEANVRRNGAGARSRGIEGIVRGGSLRPRAQPGVQRVLF